MIENANEPATTDGEQAGGSAKKHDEAATDAVSSATTAGGKLRLARENSGIHINTLAATLKVNVKVLEALENDRYEELPGIPFTRALAGSICRNLQVDAEPVLELLPDSQPQQLPEPKMQSPVILEQGGSPWFGWLRHPLTWLVLLAIVAGVTFWILPYVLDKTAPEPLRQPGENLVEELASDLNTGVTADGVAELLPVSPPLSASLASESAAPVAASGAGSALIDASGAAAKVVPGSPLISDLAVTNLEDAASAAQAEAASGAAAASVQHIPADRQLVLQASGESWVEVRNARGVVLHSTTMQAGDVLPAGGSKPYSVVVGRQENVRAYVMGQPFAFGTAGGQGAVRFSVK